jgi:putative transposase
VPVRYRRRLPHLHDIGVPIFVTWRLKDSLPAGRFFPNGKIDGRSFLAMDSLLDQAQFGSRHLQHQDIASMVGDAILYRQDNLQCCKVHAYVIMPNHVHLLLTPSIDLSKIMHSLKRHTAQLANEMLGTTGQTFWQSESYDHLVRTSDEFQKIRRYIEWNPVTAGLASEPPEFKHVWAESSLAQTAGWQPTAGSLPAPTPHYTLSTTTAVP